MVSMTLKVSVEAVNVLVLILSSSFDLISCPDPSIWDQMCVYISDGSTTARYMSRDFARNLGKYFWEVQTIREDDGFKGISRGNGCGYCLREWNCQWGTKGKWGGCANGSPSP